MRPLVSQMITSSFPEACESFIHAAGQRPVTTGKEPSVRTWPLRCADQYRECLPDQVRLGTPGGSRHPGQGLLDV
jgi:hypothetical protein